MTHSPRSITRVSRVPADHELLALPEPLEDRLLLEAQPIVSPFLEEGQHPGIGHPTMLVGDASYQTLTEIHRTTGVDLAHGKYGLTGAGQTVVIIDSGIAYDHQALGGGLGAAYRVVGGHDFTEENDADPYDDGPAGFHGTHVAGVIASDDVVHTGVAPDVDIVALRVFNDRGRGKLDWLEQSLQWVIEHLDDFRHSITTVNLSIGTDWNDLELPDYDVLEDELRTLRRRGVFVSAAAGNRFNGNAGLSYPAVSPSVISAASSERPGHISSFSQRISSSLVAPGENITSTVPDYIDDFNGIADDFYAASGTSMAAPYVAGASILVRQAMQQSGVGEITVDAIEKILVSTADQVFDASTGTTLHHINVAAAIEKVMQVKPTGGIRLEGNTLILQGTELDDRVFIDQRGMVQINGESHSFSSRLIDEIRFAAGDGHDEIVVHSRFDNTHVTFSPGRVQLSGDVIVRASDVENSQVFVGASGVTAQFQGGKGRDRLLIHPSYAWMQGADSYAYVRGAAKVIGQSQDTSDHAVIHDTQDDDVAVATPATTFLRSPRFEARVTGFSNVTLRSNEGGDDRVTMLGTFRDETVLVMNDQSTIQSGAISVSARGFENQQIEGRGGQDQARVYDSVYRDRFEMGVDQVAIRNVSGSKTLRGFSHVEAFSYYNQDQVVFHGSSNADTFIAKPLQSWMQSGANYRSARGFSAVTFVGGGGLDSARLHDSPGNDVATLGSTVSRLEGVGFQYEVSMVPLVRAFSRSGNDRVRFANRHHTDHLFANSRSAWMTGASYAAIAEAFEQVLVSEPPSDHSGLDEAWLYRFSETWELDDLDSLIGDAGKRSD